MSHTYVQRTGNWYGPDGKLRYNCYAGHGEGVNNPDMQYVSKTGPLPVGMYTMGEPMNHSHLGPYAIPLIPDSANDMRGRGDFFHHGDNGAGNRSASLGCIVHSPQADREATYNSGNRRVRVISEESELGS